MVSQIHSVCSMPQTETSPLKVTPLVCWASYPTQFYRDGPMAFKAPKLGLQVSLISVSLSLAPCRESIPAKLLQEACTVSH